jgi:2-phosphoglycerate kinase
MGVKRRTTLDKAFANRREDFVNELQRALSHTLFIGGITDAGKTTIARAIGTRQGWKCYHGDKHELRHLIKRAQVQPELWPFLTEGIGQRPIATGQGILLAHQSLQGFRERFMYCVEDLFLLDHAQEVIAEGRNFVPELVAPVLQSPHQAIWLVPSDDFFRQSTARRNKRPAYVERDLVLRDHVQAQAAIHGLRVLEVDGHRDVAAMAELVEQHFAPYLTSKRVRWPFSRVAGGPLSEYD